MRFMYIFFIYIYTVVTVYEIPQLALLNFYHRDFPRYI